MAVGNFSKDLMAGLPGQGLDHTADSPRFFRQIAGRAVTEQGQQALSSNQHPLDTGRFAYTRSQASHLRRTQLTALVIGRNELLPVNLRGL